MKSYLKKRITLWRKSHRVDIYPRTNPSAGRAVVLRTAGLSVAAAITMSVLSAPAFGNNITISNGGLSVTFDLSWGAAVTGISNTNVANGLNLVDAHDVGRALQTDQFLYQNIGGTQQLIYNPTQAGAGGGQAYYQHPSGSVVSETGSPVTSWSATASQFQAVITPLDYDTGKPTDWLYVENVRINSQGIANFHYTCYDYQPGTFSVNTEVPTLYSDRTNEFMYPASNGVTQSVTGSPSWAKNTTSNGWIGNIDATDNVGIFYTTPVGRPETYGTFSGASVSSAPPLAKTSVAEYGLTVNPGTILSSQFSVAVSTPQNGPGLIAGQSPAVSTTYTSLINNGAFSTNAGAYITSPGYSAAGGNPATPTGWTSSGNSGVNGSDTGFFGSNGNQAFAPKSTAGVSDFCFLQHSGAFISQITATQAGQMYTLAYDAATRSGNASAVLEVILTNTITGSKIISFTPTITDTAFTPFFLNFTATSGSTNIEFLNNSLPGDLTVDVSNVSLAANSVPTPASLEILALGAMALLLIGRKPNRAGRITCATARTVE